MKKGCLIPLGIVGILIAAISIYDYIVPSSAVRALPREATNVSEYYKDYGMIGDFIRLVKAKVSRETVSSYAEKVGATTKVDEDNIPRHSFSRMDLDWWDPPKDILYYYETDGYFVSIGWENEYIYFQAVAH